MAYCSRCGAKIEERVKFCPSCGAQMNEVKSQTNITPCPHDMGKLLVTTKIGVKMKSILIICCVIECIIGLFMICSIGILQDILDDTLGGLLFGLIPGVLCLASPFFIIIGHKSYCDVYENGVAGVTGLSVNNPNAPMQRFCISYSEIMNITESSRALLIYTQYATYEVLAREHRQEALMEIRSRMRLSKKPAFL